ncbi:Fc.00g008470.m01.CDS01 [Cosmosporella sp. VM-42]
MLTLDGYFFGSNSLVSQLHFLVDMAATSRPSSSKASSPDATPITSQLPVKLPRNRRIQRRIRRPAKNSIFDLIHEHAGTSLFVRPICWTDLHAQVLGARWEQLPPCDTPQPVALPGTPPSKGHMRPSQTIITLSDALSQILLPDAVHPILCSNAVKTVLMTLWPESFSKPQYLPELHLFFGGRIYRDAVRAQIMWNFPSEEVKSSYSSFMTVSTRPADSFNVVNSSCTPPQSLSNLPMVCYIGRSQLASIRKNLFRVAPGPGRSWNEPVWRLQQLRAKQLVPSNSDHDAHFVGIFLAMAQKHFYATPAASSRRESPITPGKEIPPCPKFQDVTLRILTHDTDTADFIVYTGYVTSQFLEKFHDPYKAAVDDDNAEASGIKIEYTRVPIWPILGLRERLGKALGQDVVGQFDPEEIETWETDREKHDNCKRKRGALSEVFNGSFDDESDDEPALTAKKRCLSEGTPVGVVN